MTGVELIAAERQRQIEQLGYDLTHDQQEHGDDTLAYAAAWYALDPRFRAEYLHALDGLEANAPILLRRIWPEGWDFRGNTERIRELQKAGALIAAEIDRLINMSEPEDQHKCIVCGHEFSIHSTNAMIVHLLNHILRRERAP